MKCQNVAIYLIRLGMYGGCTAGIAILEPPKDPARHGGDDRDTPSGKLEPR